MKERRKEAPVQGIWGREVEEVKRISVRWLKSVGVLGIVTAVFKDLKLSAFSALPSYRKAF